jgi:hypothetical protein
MTNLKIATDYRGEDFECGARPLIHEGWKAFREGRPKDDHPYSRPSRTGEPMAPVAAFCFETGWGVAKYFADLEAAASQL